MATKKPLYGVESLSIARTAGTHTWVAKWKVPSALTKGTKSSGKATKISTTWQLGIEGTDPRKYESVWNLSTTSSSVNVNNFKASTNRVYSRADFYPLTSRILSYVACTVTASNAGGASPRRPMVVFNFAKPWRPTVAPLEFDTATGVVSTTVTAAEDRTGYERYDTEYYFTVRRSDTGEELLAEHDAFTSATKALSYNVGSYQSIPQGAYVEVTCKARSRGYAGDGEWREAETLYVAFPNVPSITGVTVPSRTANDRVTATIDTGETPTHPVTQVRLQALANVDYATVAEVDAATDQWQDVGAADDGACTALACAVGDVIPASGKHSWLRVKSWYLVEAALVTYSRPVEVSQLYVPATTATADSVAIVNAQSGEDGTTALVTLAWAPSGTTDESDGTELSWSDQPDTWRSTDEPNVYEVTYDDGPLTSGGVSYQSSATIAIKGLDEGATTYIKARRYREGDSGLVYGPYGNTAVVVPSVAPASVTLDVPGFVPEGEGIPCTWTFSGGSPQTAWQLLLDSGVIVAEGTDAMGSATIDADRAESLATDNALTVSVAVSTGGAWVQSAPKTVNIVQRPTLAVTPSATYAAQPVSVPFTCSAAGARLAVVVISLGTDGDGPAGMVLQAAGDVVWSGVVTPTGSTVELPAGLPFVDGTGYRIEATATDPMTGLTSEPASAEFSVAWAHQAPDPDGCVTLTPIDTIGADGSHQQAVRIDLVPPTGSAATDVYDIYRLTADGPQLIGQSWPLASTAVDGYAPYGDRMTHHYRIACRTADGDADWFDAPYEMGGSALRIDWTGGSVELPYDLAITDGYAKDVDVHAYLDGGVDAFYNQGTQRTAKLGTNVLRLEDADTIAAVRELARFVGPAFVRTPDGSAYEADVQVSDMTPTYELSAVSISATEVTLTPAYQLPTFNVEEG